jgi:hydrogenase maturation factor
VSSPPSTAACLHEHCITCSDEGVPMTVLRVDEHGGLALCADLEGARHTAETALVELPALGDLLLVHAGVAIATLSAGPSA